jgi:hypothetical protein
VLPASCRNNILKKQVRTAGKMRGSTLLAHLRCRTKAANSVAALVKARIGPPIYIGGYEQNEFLRSTQRVARPL